MAGRRTAERVAVVQRRTQAVEMRIQGKSWQAVADALGYRSKGAACQDVTRALEAAVTEQKQSIELLREQELQALDGLLTEAWDVLKRAHVTVSHGRVVRDDDEEPIPDDGPVLQAIDRVLKIRERRAKLLGLDAPQRHEVVTLDAVDAEIRRLTAELGGSVEAGEAAPAPEAAPAEG